MCIKQFIGFAAALTLGAMACTDARTPTGLSGPDLRNANAQPVGVCHYDDDLATWVLLTVAGAALPAHVNHGDAQPGQAVPGSNPPAVFGDNCEVVPVEVPLFVCSRTDLTRDIVGNFSWTYSGSGGTPPYTLYAAIDNGAPNPLGTFTQQVSNDYFFGNPPYYDRWSYFLRDAEGEEAPCEAPTPDDVPAQ